jgi:hypothetical protein
MYIATSSNGYWGRGRSADGALVGLRSQGGRGDRLLFRLHDAWDSAIVNDWGQIYAFISDERVAAGEETPSVPVIVEAWEVSANGKRKDVSARFGSREELLEAEVAV